MPDPSRPTVTPLDVRLSPDPMRTVIRPFMPGDPAAFAVPGHPRAERIVQRILAMDPHEWTRPRERMRESLNERHRDVDELLKRRFEEVKDCIPAGTELSPQQHMLIGAYFSAEYSFEAAALFNPSAVPHPDQSGVEEGAMRILVSLRGIGEGHLSSVTFRTGTWNADDTLTMDKASDTAVPPAIERPEGWHNEETVQLDCTGSREPSETVLFPVIDSQARGIEDLRLTPFRDPEGHDTFVGSFTAVGVEEVQQQLLQTDNFRTFKMQPVKGDLAASKGMALFPRKIGDRWLAIGRQDNENLWLAWSDDIITWHNGEKLLEPKYPWEIIQLGNCGSPLEIDEGWLVLTHGVGVVRNYCMGAILLDRDDPSKVLGRLAEPLLEPSEDDRDGYVPNVVYSCGGIVRGRTLLLPYGEADNYATFATVNLDELVAAMVAP